MSTLDKVHGQRGADVSRTHLPQLHTPSRMWNPSWKRSKNN